MYSITVISDNRKLWQAILKQQACRPFVWFRHSEPFVQDYLIPLKNQEVGAFAVFSEKAIAIYPSIVWQQHVILTCLIRSLHRL